MRHSRAGDPSKESYLLAGETVRHGKGRQESDGKRKVRGVLHRFAEVDRRSGRVPICHTTSPRSYVWRLRPENQGMERHR